jgi:hypothetical protein
MKIIRLPLLLALCLFGSPLSAQEPLWDELQRRIKSEPISLGALFQFVGDAQVDRSFPGEDGFSVANFRLSLSGQLDGGFDYFLQSNFGGLLDARIGLTLHPSLTIDAGRFKTPYSREFLTGAGSIDFVNRSQSVTALAPNRALGVAARGALGDELSYSAGVFNGGGGLGGNARGEMLGVARLSWQRDDLEVALNGARQGDRRVINPGANDPSIATVRNLVGVDARLTQDRWLFAAELDIGDGQIGTQDDPWGGFATLGYMTAEDSQLLIRLDHFDTGALGDERTLLIPGWNLWPTAATELQINAVLPLEGFNGDPQLLINLQLAF